MQTTTGIFTGFEGYAHPTRESVDEAVRSALVVLDTNVLLHLYSLHGRALRDFLDVFAAVGDRLFIPHQVMAEFWRARNQTLTENQGRHRELRVIEDSFATIEKHLKSWHRRMIDTATAETSDELKNLRAVAEQISARINQTNETSQIVLPNTPSHEDQVVAELEKLLEGKIEAAPAPETAKQLQAEGERRLKQRTPPGYMDADKDPVRAVGDFLVWRAAMDEAGRRGTSLLLVTNDVKEDWWSGPLPRPELVHELLAETGQALVMMRAHDLLGHSHLLGVEVSEQTLRRENENSRGTTTDTWTVDLALDYLALLDGWPAHRVMLSEALRDPEYAIRRARIAELLERDPDTRLQGSHRPFNTALSRLFDQHPMLTDLVSPMDLWYEEGAMVRFFVPDYVVEVFVEAEARATDV